MASTTVSTSPLTVGQVYTTNTTAGQYLINGSNGTTWTNPADHVMIASNNPAQLEVKGRMIINGRDLEERLNTIEKVLQIPERDVKLEKKHPKLKKLHDEYIKELSKYRMWNTIKGEDDVA
jgi:predicted transcriptional regulator